MPQLPNLHSLANSGQPLCVHCLTCGHRAALPPDEWAPSQGNMTEVRSLKLKCSLCLNKNVEAFVVHSEQTVAHFLAGADLAIFRKWR
jgi:hypothetical protein